MHSETVMKGLKCCLTIIFTKAIDFLSFTYNNGFIFIR
jgi:hypothetical protein